jgi:acid phosphatase (class B)
VFPREEVEVKDVTAMKRFVPAWLFPLLLVASCQSTRVDAPTTRRAPTSKVTLTAVKAREIDFEQLEALLPRRPIVVGFDIDDTLIISTPAFAALEPWYDPEVVRPRNYSKLSAEQNAKHHEFWTKLNDVYDDRSTPRAIARRLLDLHLARGDDIWLISTRQASITGIDKCTPRYQKMFNIKFPHGVVFTQLKDPTPFIAQRKIEYHYGDSDSDITAAQAAGAVPIRVKRAAGSYAKDIPHNGQFGEIVLKDLEE